MMQKIQKFGGAMFTPVLLFAFSGIMVGLTTVLTSEVIVGSIAEATTTWYKVWWTVKEGAWTIFRQIPLLFVVSLPIGLAKKQQARACMEALLLYLTFNYFIAAILTNWGTALGVDYSIEAGNGTGLALVAPTAASVTQIAQIYDADSEYASAYYFVTTLLCILTMPVFVWFYQL